MSDHRKTSTLIYSTLTFFRSKKTSITTGIVDRSEIIKTEAVDRLSPLTSAFGNFISFPGINDSSNDLEKYSEMDIDTASTSTSSVQMPSCYKEMLDTTEQTSNDQLQATITSITAGTNISGNTRRHTVGPGDVQYEQSLANPAVPISFKFGPENGPHLPINLPMLQNQPLHNFTIKNQHLLKPPTVMGASKCWKLNFCFCSLEKVFVFRRFVWTTCFRRWCQFAHILSGVK